MLLELLYILTIEFATSGDISALSNTIYTLLIIWFYIVYIKHNNMEMKRKKKSNFGVISIGELSISHDRRRELYDSYLFKGILFWTDRYVPFYKGSLLAHINKWLLPAYILWSCRRISSYDAVFLNSSWFAQSYLVCFIFSEYFILS